MTAFGRVACRCPGQGLEVSYIPPRCAVPPASIVYRGIGHIENQFVEPTAPEKIRSGESQIVLDPSLVAGLTGLKPGMRMMVIFHFHRSEGFDLVQHPRGDKSQPLRGVFALRSPHRPNPIGVTVVDLMSVKGHVLCVRGLDALDGTPVLDLKPA